MFNSKIPGANPHITVMNPQNSVNYNDADFDETAAPILRGFVSDNHLKLSFVALWNENVGEKIREFQVSKFDALYLSGRDVYSDTATPGDLTVDKIITEDSFPELKLYSIKINSINIHDYVDFETNDFIFEDEDKLNALLDMIDQAFKMKIKGEK